MSMIAETIEISRDDQRLKYGIFNLMEASKYLGVPWRTMYNWGRGTRAGVPLQRIRPAVAELKREIGLEHALASRNLSTDGAEVLYRYAGDDSNHTVVRSKQKQFSRAVADYLKPISYADDGFADRLWLPIYGEEAVYVDPRKAFGHPLLKGGRARVEDVADRFAAGESIEDLAFDFRISPAEVERVIRVEALAPRAAA